MKEAKFSLEGCIRKFKLPSTVTGVKENRHNEQINQTLETIRINKSRLTTMMGRRKVQRRTMGILNRQMGPIPEKKKQYLQTIRESNL